jgi:hypothetical protein
VFPYTWAQILLHVSVYILRSDTAVSVYNWGTATAASVHNLEQLLLFSYTWGTDSATCVCTHLRATAVSVHTWEQLQLCLYTPEEQLLPLLCTSGEKFVLHLCSRRPPPFCRQPRAARMFKMIKIPCCSVLYSVDFAMFFYVRENGGRRAFGIRMETPAMDSTVCTSERFDK